MEGRFGFSLVYVDAERQKEFVAVFGESEEMKRCPNGERARPVILLKRQSSHFALYDWYSKFCGVSGDGRDLLSHASTVSMMRRVMLPDLVDEFAPGALGQLWKSVVQWWYDVYDYFSTGDSQALTLLVTILVMAMVMCCLSVIGVSQNMEEQRRGQRQRRAHRNNPSDPVPNQHPATPRPEIDTLHIRIPSLTRELYQEYVEHAPKGMVTIVLFAGSHNTAKIVRAFAEVVKRHNRPRMKFFCTSYATHCHWLKEVLRVSNVESIEREERNKVSFNELFTVLGIFGSKKQFVIFPELTGGAYTTPSCNGPGQKSEWSHTANVALNSLGFGDDDNYESESTHHIRKRKPSSHKELSKGRNSRQEEEVGDSRGDVQAQAIPVGTEGSTDLSDADSGGEEEEGSVGCRGVAVGCGDHVRWLREGLGVWLERLEDGSLRRYSVDYWPELEETEPSCICL